MKAISELPLAFCIVPPAVLRVNDPIVPEPPSGYIRLEDGMMTPADVTEEEFQLLRNAKELASKATLEKAGFISWAASHACRQPTTAHFPAVISLLPMFYENATLDSDDSSRYEYDQSCSKSCQPEPNTCTCYYTRSTPFCTWKTYPVELALNS